MAWAGWLLMLLVQGSAFSLFGSSESSPGGSITDAATAPLGVSTMSQDKKGDQTQPDIHGVKQSDEIDHLGNGALSSKFSTEANLNAHDINSCADTALTPDPLVSTGTYYQPFSFRKSKNLKTGSNLLIMSHGLVQWFNTETKTSTVVLAKPRERFRGAFVQDNFTLVVLATPNMKQDSHFVMIDPTAGKEVGRAEAKGCRDGHDVVRYGEMAYAICTGSGSINVYDAVSLRLVRRFTPYTRGDHINTIGVSSSSIFVMLHNLGRKPSEMHVLRRHDAKSIRSYGDIGTMAHGITQWTGSLLGAKEAVYFVSLDSGNGKLVKYNMVYHHTLMYHTP
jgi:hypothetical protein